MVSFIVLFVLLARGILAKKEALILSKEPFIPPLPHVDLSDVQVPKTLNPEGRSPEKQAKIDAILEKYRRPTPKELRARKFREILDYCKKNWMGIISALAGLAAAVFSALSYFYLIRQ